MLDYNIVHGIDLVDWTRNEFKNKKLPFKILHNDELYIYNKIFNKEEKLKFIASRWSIKEAIIKASNKKINMSTLKVEYNKERPYVIFENDKYNVSMSYEGNFIVASAITIRIGD